MGPIPEVGATPCENVVKTTSTGSRFRLEQTAIVCGVSETHSFKKSSSSRVAQIQRVKFEEIIISITIRFIRIITISLSRRDWVSRAHANLLDYIGKLQ